MWYVNHKFTHFKCCVFFFGKASLLKGTISDEPEINDNEVLCTFEISGTRASPSKVVWTSLNISHSTNTLGKGMNPIILPPAMGK